MLLSEGSLQTWKIGTLLLFGSLGEKSRMVVYPQMSSVCVCVCGCVGVWVCVCVGVGVCPIYADWSTLFFSCHY